MTLRRPTAISSATGLLAGLALVCLAQGAAAQSTTKTMEGMKLSNDQPIQIQSDQLQIKDEEKKAYFTGNVQVVQGATTMRSGSMTVLYKGEGTTVSSGQTDIDKIFIDDKVVLTSGTQQASADNGVFDMASQTFVLTGKQVVLSDGPNVFKGCKLTVHMETGEAKLDACGGRVEIMLDPKSRPQQPKP
ncbi:LptA/OstA family protein [Rhizobium sp. CSW-27]|uniref:LptA/OstA family protein n=1 Tax=Rhizobium sp. CSW-27 TaxID=2839985 RepID=UPI001C00E6FF|nr:LptA/OstA family protein [Rhizobium sp. CSW-27]MBT9372137.1 LptA/OstA family protein [Rhizobium sp. CSW-27]